MLVVLLAYPTSSVVSTTKQKLQSDRAQDEKPGKQSTRDKKAESAPLRVRLNVTVFDSSNRPVTDVSQVDFQVFENNVQQTITSVTQRDGPLSFGLLVDCSGSLRFQNSDLIRAGRSIIANMKPEDEAFVIRFISHDKITLIQDWTSNRTKLNSKLNEIYPEGGESAIVDAVYIAAQHIAERRKLETSPHRHALVLITDGEDRMSYYNLEQLLKLMRDSDLQIFVIGLVQQIEGIKPQEMAMGLLNALANETGGRVFLMDRKLELQEISAEIAKERDAQYLIEYNSTNGARDGSFRKVRVTIKEKDGRDKRIALTRLGYAVPGK